MRTVQVVYAWVVAISAQKSGPCTSPSDERVRVANANRVDAERRPASVRHSSRTFGRSLRQWLDATAAAAAAGARKSLLPSDVTWQRFDQSGIQGALYAGVQSK
jgi:hypothetical protein